MDKPCRDGNLESILEDPSAQPCRLSLQYLKDITQDFSVELGNGGFGIVYKGTLPNGKMVAVKDLLLNQQFLEKYFEREVGNLMRLDRHQNVVRFLGYCYESTFEWTEHGGRHVFAESPKMLLCFEYVHNKSLDKHISEESSGLDWRKRYKIIKGICCGIHHLHEDGKDGSIIHMDLKPANILLDEKLVPKIADFGLSKFFNHHKKLETSATSLVGSCGYMAPEIFVGGKISKMADIYSLGVIILQIITGRMIDITSCEDFVGPVLENWCNRQQRIPSKIDCEQIKFCLEIGLGCVEYKREKRPSIREILENLNKWETTNGYESYDSDEECPPTYKTNGTEAWSSNGRAVPEPQSPPGVSEMSSGSESDNGDGDAASDPDHPEDSVALHCIGPDYNPGAIEIHEDGINLIYDDRRGARWRSRSRFIPGKAVEGKIRAPEGDTSGLKYNFYLSSHDGFPGQDEIHFDFPGHNKRAVQTSYCVDGEGGREQMHQLPFDCSDDFHKFAIAWNDDVIEWRVDGDVIRREKRRQFLREQPLPTKPMFLYASVCDASYIDEGSWAGVYNGSDAPYVCSYKDIMLPLAFSLR